MREFKKEFFNPVQVNSVVQVGSVIVIHQIQKGCLWPDFLDTTVRTANMEKHGNTNMQKKKMEHENSKYKGNTDGNPPIKNV